MNKLDFFKVELKYIKNNKIREFTEKVIENLPDYFFTIPASSTGKYHPIYATGEGGLVRHTQAAVRIAIELFTITPIYTSDEKDCIISALILHDGFKCGIEKSQYTKHEHPLIMGNFIRESNELKEILDIELIEKIASGVESHMGQWCTNKYSKTVLKTPQTKLENFIHWCDYLASRKILEFNFEVNVAYRQ